MKHYLLLLFISIFTLSCSSDDDNPEEIQQDPIIGEWQFGKVIYYHNDDTQEILDPTQCDLQSSYTFLQDNSYVLRSFIQNNNDVCEIEDVGDDIFLWENLGDGEYLFSIEDSEETSTQSIEFQGNQMIVTEEFEPHPISTVTKIESYFKRQN